MITAALVIVALLIGFVAGFAVAASVKPTLPW